MTLFKCRAIKPTETTWYEIEASSANDAANSFHERETPHGVVRSLKYENQLGEGRSETIYFAVIEVEGHEPVVSKVYYSGLRRRGGIKVSRQRTLADIAKDLGWTHPVEELLQCWDGDESWEEASKRSR